MDGVWIAAIAAGVLVAIILSQWFFLVRYKKRNRTNLERMESLEKEHRYMESVLETNRDAKVNAILRNRASLISRLIAAEISGDTEVNESVMEEIGTLVSEREEFMRQNRMLYERWQPDMIERLRACGLTDEEIEVCCLYAMGLNGKTIQQYTQDGRHYQNVGLIRKKQGLGEHDKNIDGYIKSLIR